MTAAAEPPAQLGSELCGHVGIITEDATVISVTNFETAPQPLAGSADAKLTALDNNNPSDVSADAAPAESCSEDKPAAQRSESEGASLGSKGAKSSLSAIPVKRGRRCSLFRQVPSYIWIALGVLVVAEALAVTGAILYARSVNRDARRAAADVARSSARSIETVLDRLIAPVMSLANLVHLEPHWPTVSAHFPVFSDAIYQTNKYYQIELCPYGIVGSMAMPWMNATGNITSEEWMKIQKIFDLGLDIMNPNRSSYNVELGSILQDGSVALLGPWYADGELSSGAFVVRYSVFLPPGDWDMPPSSIEACPREVCNTPSGLTWWGWSNAVFAWKTVAPSLSFIQDRNLLYTLAPDPRAENQSFLAMSERLPNPDDCEAVRVDVYGWMHWTFCVEPASGFGPSWRSGLLVGVTALALLLAGLVGLVLRSRHQAVKYLARQLETNRQLAIAKEEAEEGRRTLEAEKRVMDALLLRQRNLIELFGKEDELLNAVAAEGSEGSVQRRLLAATSANGGSQVSLSRESATVDRIEAVRRQLTGMRSVKQSASGGADVKLLEMLGEGSFGKVYRGVWRGTDVAVKTMVLPANMSGAEKREKMAIMEAAISSSLAHPNIVQTYTYFIKTVREERDDSDTPSGATEGILVGGTDASTVAGGSSIGKTFDDPPQRNSSPAVHGYEVRLVLEFCDRGCLRDALDGNAFLTATGVNYAGVLDTAADIAKAMLHLHLADVLHGDLKARNVMLKSSGTEGRGVTCKVADFGLAVKIDTMEQTHMSGMYQGTLTHMAPELLLHGRMSKAVDVYAFGVTLWELFTGGHAFQGVPRALLGHQIAQERRRPAFPPFAPEAYVRLAEDCWAHRPEDRPSFETILERLGEMRGSVPGPAAALAAYDIGPPAATPQAQAPPLPKLDGAPPGLVNSTPNPVFDPTASGSGSGGGLILGGSGSGTGINWAFAKSSHRTPLAVVEEEDQELDVSSKKLPLVGDAPAPHHNHHNHLNHHLPGKTHLDDIQEGAPGAGTCAGGDSRASPQAGALAPQSPLPSGPMARTAASLSQSGSGTAP
ncbi:hypothetical protein PLESTB_000377300 [Pleodorina starrii]|uniref:Protein kinase domain-containing protein n=1 Tax=Pleodorina starrii TaxID=330485 RepID=A0A9W6BE81_9CHLO|nr:hypothetical protein PLESTM_000017600 [Pleodorina starrii]GLC50418.1 hypothetical protein PLESTB_000377300 [Pleodorina starrii]GLC64201.1 hypothetical protein PLESTF_000135400 [Pleodorina starrii]